MDVDVLGTLVILGLLGVVLYFGIPRLKDHFERKKKK